MIEQFPVFDTRSRGRYGRAGLPTAFVLRMYKDYERGLSAQAVGLLHGRTRQCVWELFKSHGLPLRAKRFQAKICHRGVSYTMHKGYLRATSGPRIPLHHVIWEERHGPIPPGHLVMFSDGNPWNVAITNLQLISAADLARANQDKFRTRTSRELTAILLKQSQQKVRHGHAKNIDDIRANVKR